MIETTMRCWAVLFCCLLLFATNRALAESAEATFEREIRPLLERHCTDCHGLPDEAPEADLSLAKFDTRASVLAARQTWKKVLDVVEDHAMPPQDAAALSPQDRTRLIEWIRRALSEPEFGDRRNPGRPVLRRLTRLEYNNTVRDLLGLETDVFMFSERLPFEKDYFQPAAGKMPERLRVGSREYGARYPVLLPGAGLPGDSRAEHGFSNRGDAQNFSDVRLEQYVELAERIAFHPELLSRAARMQEMFPHADFRSTPAQNPSEKKVQQIVTSVGRLAPNDNIAKTAGGSAFSLDELRKRLKAAFAEDRGGVYDASQNANSTIAGKGGVLHLAYGDNAQRVFGVNPSEDLWNAAFATAEESSGGVLFTNKEKNVKKFFFGFQASGGQPWRGISELGVVVLSRRGQSGTVRVTAEFDGGRSQSIDVSLKEGPGADNTFVSFAAPDGETIRRLSLDGSGFSGEYVLLDDLAFITRDEPSQDMVTGRELPNATGRELPDDDDPVDREKPASHSEANPIDRSLAKQPPRRRLAHFMHRTFRRLVEAAEVDLYFGLYESARAKGADDEAAMRAALHGVLSSPSFLYLLEGGKTADEGQPVVPLTDHEVAARLSYFLWSSMPDDELLALADAGRLQDERVLEQQTRRMLRDPRARELGESFFVEWLRLRELWSAQPDDRQFREFYEGPQGKRTLAPDMFCEALLLLETILVEDRSVLELIHADYTYLNNRLARLYGMETPSEDDREWRRVTLVDDRRGGVLTMGATLTLTSFPHRTSPIRRGAWFLETIFNRPPPPPKIAVADIDEQKGLEASLTLREKVERHRADAACAVCHNRLDPPGFALENFDAIGRWREADGEEKIDASGELAGGVAFSGPVEFKRRILEQEQRFLRGFVEHLLSYAVSRKLEYYDIAAVEEIVAAASSDDYRLSRIVIELVKSPTFRNFHVQDKQ
ncbi:MAG: DUF1592 domain-containing protein [Pirellulaceae bacterium]